MNRSPRYAVLVDFDGTACVSDVGGQLFETFARDARWKTIDDDYLAGRLGSRAAYRLAEELLRHDSEQWLRCAHQLADLDPGLPALTALCQRQGWPLEVLSDGLEFYIHAILARAGLDLPVRANRIRPDGVRSGGIGPVIDTPHMNPLCGRCGTCKSERVGELRRRGWTVVYIGDGPSDLCAAPRADRIFAKGVLAHHCSSQGVPFRRFDHLGQVAADLSPEAARNHSD